MMIAIGQSSLGQVVAAAGSVIDVEFADESLPPIDEALLAEIDQDRRLMLEVHQHLDRKTVRTVAMAPTEGTAPNTIAASAAGVSILAVGACTPGSTPHRLAVAMYTNSVAMRGSNGAASRRVISRISLSAVATIASSATCRRAGRVASRRRTRQAKPPRTSMMAHVVTTSSPIGTGPT